MSAPAVAAKPFAKLFETARGQILVMRGQSEEHGAPEVRFYFDPACEGLTVCSMALHFPDSDAGERAADDAFAEVNQERTEQVVFKYIETLQSAMGAAA